MSVQQSISSNLCQHCARSSACFGSLNNTTSQTAHRSHKIYHRGESLFSMGDEFEALYILRAGSAKSICCSSNGEEQISGFYYPGDMIGADGFDSMTHSCGLKFLETSSVCRVGLKELDMALIESSSTRRKLLKNMSHALVDEQQMLMSIGKLNSEQRLAKFLLDLSERFQIQGLSANTFDLSMTRIDIANFLGMAIETISRLLTKLQHQQIIKVNRRQVILLDIQRLQQCLLVDSGISWLTDLQKLNLKNRQSASLVA